jgi:hypothetical protein
LRVIRERGGSLGHLHQAEHAFIHPRAAAGGNDDDGQFFFRAAFNQPRQFFADDRTHRAAEKIKIHHAERDAVLADLAEAGHDGVLERGVFLVRVPAWICKWRAFEAEHVHARHFRVHLLERAGLDERMDAFARADGKMMLHFGQTFKFSSSSLSKTIVSHVGHFVQSPSGCRASWFGFARADPGFFCKIGGRVCAMEASRPVRRFPNRVFSS